MTVNLTKTSIVHKEKKMSRMKMKKFERPEMEVIRFEAEDVIMTSGGCSSECSLVCSIDCKSVTE